MIEFCYGMENGVFTGMTGNPELQVAPPGVLHVDYGEAVAETEGKLMAPPPPVPGKQPEQEKNNSMVLLGIAAVAVVGFFMMKS